VWGCPRLLISDEVTLHCTAHLNNGLGFARRSAKQASQATSSFPDSLLCLLHHVFRLPISLFTLILPAFSARINRFPKEGAKTYDRRFGVKLRTSRPVVPLGC